MKDRLVPVDRKKHLLYSKSAKKVIRRDLAARYPGREEELWEKVQMVYADFVQDLPFCGGKKNFQARGIYDSLGLLAWYEALPEKPGLSELEKLNDAVFVPKHPKPVSLNWKWGRRAAHGIFSHVAKEIHDHEKEWVGNYRMEVAPYDPEVGVYYRFTFCPIADFAKKHGYGDLMPALCNADYPMLKALHGGLIRCHTCANGPYCDYHILGDKDSRLEKYPAVRDEAGYVRNPRAPMEEQKQPKGI